jgi:hypothetical protein
LNIPEYRISIQEIQIARAALENQNGKKKAQKGSFHKTLSSSKVDAQFVEKRSLSPFSFCFESV